MPDVIPADWVEAIHRNSWSVVRQSHCSRTLALRLTSDGDFVAFGRFPSTDNAARWVRQEGNLLRRLAAVGIPVPQVQVLDDTGAVLGSPAFLCAAVRGPGLTQPALVSRLTIQAHALAVAAMHALAWPTLEDVCRVPTRNLAHKELDRLLVAFPRGHWLHPQIRALERFPSTDDDQCLIHRDLTAGNTAGPPESPTLLDWECALWGPRAWDLAFIPLFLLGEETEEYRIWLDTYRSRASLPSPESLLFFRKLVTFRHYRIWNGWPPLSESTLPKLESDELQ
jgi:aminoglycoside phosphotransferase (APT) family kinase protein